MNGKDQVKRVVLSTILVLMLSPPAHAQTPPAAAELTKLLKEFLAGASRNDAAMHDRFWAEELIYTSSSGRRMGKADILRELPPVEGRMVKPVVGLPPTQQ
jgi:hypothetical protein